ncbi:MAG: DUF2922 domain-containing protein, partial [Selenomonadaceae bacterium]
MAMNKKLQLTFKLDSGKTLTFNLPDPKDGLTRVEAEAAMTQMITKKAVASKNGLAVAI